jgi:hypothetical protein
MFEYKSTLIEKVYVGGDSMGKGWIAATGGLKEI